jgi:hypothetical protein
LRTDLSVGISRAILSKGGSSYFVTVGVELLDAIAHKAL